jgi:hypothetical protein
MLRVNLFSFFIGCVHFSHPVLYTWLDLKRIPFSNANPYTEKLSESLKQIIWPAQWEGHGLLA